MVQRSTDDFDLGMLVLHRSLYVSVTHRAHYGTKISRERCGRRSEAYRGRCDEVVSAMPALGSRIRESIGSKTKHPLGSNASACSTENCAGSQLFAHIGRLFLRAALLQSDRRRPRRSDGGQDGTNFYGFG